MELRSGKTVGPSTCPICFEDSADIKCNECKHVFCISCLNRWFENKFRHCEKNCPICRSVTLFENSVVGHRHTSNYAVKIDIHINADRRACVWLNGAFVCVPVQANICFPGEDKDGKIHSLFITQFIMLGTTLYESDGNFAYASGRCKNVAEFEDYCFEETLRSHSASYVDRFHRRHVSQGTYGMAGWW